MSRLIFEGDTTDRFGKLFPKPFIQEIRVYDDLIQADVMLFFEVPLGDASSAALIAKIDDNLRVFGAFLERDQFNKTINPDSQNEFYKNSFFALNFDQNDFVRSNPLTNVEYHYNSEGKRFAKCLVTFDYSGIASFLGIERDRYFATFTSFTTPTSELEQLETTDQAALLNAKDYQNTLLRNQTSDLVYEKIFNADNTLNTGKQNVYQQPDGNYYGKTPLQSLGKTYKQADRVTHRNILQIINPIISPYAGSNEEANKVSVTLSQYANDPMLLTQLEKDIKSFTNKSSATTTGQLYGELVRAVADIDNLLQNEPTLDKRLETNSKIVDLRLEKTPDTLQGLKTSNIDLNSLQDFSNFIYNPLSSRSLYIKNYNSDDPAERYAVRNDIHMFYDYEKSLNYQSEISQFLNPYNILEIFGKNCLNSYFEVEEVRIKFMKQSEEVKIYGDGKTLSVYSTTDADNNFDRTLDETLPVIGDQYLYSHVAERYFDTVDGLGGYKLKYYNIVELSSVYQASQQQSQELTIKVIDKTMQFYRDHIAKIVIETFEQLGEYLEFANQFCSYNNLDKRFNDFFVNSMNDEFDDPYPWNHAPLIYYSMVSLLQSSYQTVGGWSASSRKKDGTSIDLLGVQKNAVQRMLKISPTSGDLENLNLFYEQFKTLKNYFIKGDGLDGGNEIYSDEEEGNKLLKGEISLEIFRRFSNLDTTIIDSFQSFRTYKSWLSITSDADQSEPLSYSYAEGLWVALSNGEKAYIFDSLGDASTDPEFSDWTTLFDGSYNTDNIAQAYSSTPGDENKLKKAFLNIVSAYLDAKNTYDYDGNFTSFALRPNLDGFTEEGS